MTSINYKGKTYLCCNAEFPFSRCYLCDLCIKKKYEWRCTYDEEKCRAISIFNYFIEDEP